MTLEYYLAFHASFRPRLAYIRCRRLLPDDDLEGGHNTAMLVVAAAELAIYAARQEPCSGTPPMIIILHAR